MAVSKPRPVGARLAPLLRTQVTHWKACVCTELVGRPIAAAEADRIVPLLKAVDLVRLWLLSLIGAHAGGEVCVCDSAAGLTWSRA